MNEFLEKKFGSAITQVGRSLMTDMEGIERLKCGFQEVAEMYKGQWPPGQVVYWKNIVQKWVAK